MGFINQCADAGAFCERFNRFSNPNQKVKKKPFGIRAGNPNLADDMRRLNKTQAGGASYR